MRQYRRGLGDIINSELHALFEGCCAQFNQPFYLGKVDDAWQDIAEIGAESFAAGIGALKPGLAAGWQPAPVRIDA